MVTIMKLTEMIAGLFRTPTTLIHETSTHIYHADKNNNIIMRRKLVK